MTALMLVESPNKAKTIAKYLRGTGITVMASFGHIREIDTKKKLFEAIEPENGFKTHYVVGLKSKDHAKKITDAAKGVDTVYLATDPDREGEAIAWHLWDMLKGYKNIKTFKRVTYTEVNEKAVKQAISQAGELDFNKAYAGLARQIIDKIFGFSISPVLWKALAPGLSAGRVQSPGLHLVSEREREIQAFIATIFWSVSGNTAKDNITFPVKLSSIDTVKIDKATLNEKDYTKEYVEGEFKKILDLMAKKEPLKVIDVVKTKVSNKPKAPYMTSTLQMDAVRQLGWSAQRVMAAAQKLFEGDGGEHGYITYHRTDSVNMAEDALKALYQYVGDAYGEEYRAAKPIVYSGKKTNAQEAHECIRPSDIDHTPDMMANRYDKSSDEYKLYRLIWCRTVASQMAPSLSERTAIVYRYGDRYQFKANGSVVLFDGYRRVYQEGRDKKDEEDSHQLPVIEVGDEMLLLHAELGEHETSPPSRYNEATLVKQLEDYGIGRPSTYATICARLKDRNYIKMDSKRIDVNEMGLEVDKFLTSHFSQYVDYGYTAKMEEMLDDIATGKASKEEILDRFYRPLMDNVKTVTDHFPKEERGVLEHTGEKCPQCGDGEVIVRLGKYGKFKTCTKRCGYVLSLSEKKIEHEVVEGRSCPNCKSPLHVIKGRFGKFISCSNYKECKYSEKMDGTVKVPPTDTGVKCPKCKKKNLVVRSGKRGKFISCSGFPKCRHIVNESDFRSISGLSNDQVDAMLK